MHCYDLIITLRVAVVAVNSQADNYSVYYYYYY